MHAQNRIIYALQFHPVCDISADSLPALLVHLRPLYQKVEVAVTHAERIRGGGQLYFLWLVGLAFPDTHRLHFALLMGQRVTDRKSRDQEKG